jgi:predicted nucleotidyltransferase
MSMLQQFNEQENFANAKQQSYENVRFPHGFFRFMESMVFEQLITEDNKHIRVGQLNRWTNDIGIGGVRLETTKRPDYVDNNVGDMIVVGSPDNLTVFNNLLERYGVQYEGSNNPEDITLNIEYHNELNPKLWRRQSDTFVLHPDIQQALEDTAEAFYVFLDLPDLEIEDIIITGSSANYNWTDSSDLDLHIVINVQKAEQKYGKVAMKYFDMAKKVYNDLHDINIKGVPVEFYVQDEDEEHNSTGMYSLKDEEWVLEPQFEKPDYNDSDVRAKAAQWMDLIDDVCSSNKADIIDAFMKKLSKLRQAGLEKGGEFSVENLAFKTLRNEGFLDRLAECKIKSYDRVLSTEEEEWSKLRS